MRTADLVITKPGGLTITEALYLQKPLLLYSPIPGQEEANVKFLEKNNLGKMIIKPQDTSILIKKVIAKPNFFNKKTISSHVNEEIVDAVISR
jgi:processive 1,2-diacylglycerol beta-glucosyltransferase